MPRSILSALLSWCGIIGGAIGLFSNLETLLRLAEWARWLVGAWNHWVNLGWDLLLSRLNFDLTPGSRFQSTMAVTITMIAIGSRLSANKSGDGKEWSPGVHNIIRTNVGAAVAIFALHSWFFGYYLSQATHQAFPQWFWNIQGLAFYGIYAAAIFVGLLHWPLFARTTATIAAVVFSEAFQRAAQTLQPSSRADETMSLLWGSGISIVAGLAVIFLAPPKAFAHRVWFLIVGLGVLIGLNELSKLGIDVTAPAKRT